MRWALLLVVGWALAGPAAAGPVYTLDILSDQFHPGLTGSTLTHLNNAGTAAGAVRYGGPTLPATLTAGGAPAVIPGVELLFNSVNGINAAGAVVGYGFSTDGPGGGVFVAENGGLRFFVPDGSLDVVFPGGIGTAGTVYGDVFVEVDGEVTVRVFVAAPDGSTAILPAPAGYGGFVTSTFGPPGLSDTGLLAAAAVSDDFTTLLGILYDLPTGAIIPLQLPAGYAEGYAYQVTPGGVIFGDLFGGPNFGTGFWNPDGSFDRFLDLPAGVPGGVIVNDRGQALGLGGDGVPVLYAGGVWSPVSLPVPAGYTLVGVSGFNDRGDFVGTAIGPDGRSWGFLATAVVPEPASAVLAGLGAVCVGIGRRRLRSASDGGRS